MKAHNNSELDSKLASAGQQAVRQIVHDLPEDTLSLAWRSSLNERLLAVPVSRRPRIRFAWFAMPAAGAAVACVLAVSVFFRTPGQSLTPTRNAPAYQVESALMDAYRQESVSHEIEGAGPDPSFDSHGPSLADVASDSYTSEVDPESL